MKDEQTFKTIKIKKDVWKKLNYLKLEEDAKTISQIINKLIVSYEEKK
jgi:predicted CopG family antitoxin